MSAQAGSAALGSRPAAPAIRRLLEDVLAEVKGADEAEAVLDGGDVELTRFANSAIHQNVAERGFTLRLRVVVGGRVGVVAGNDLTRAGARRMAEDAIATARQQEPNPEWPGLPGAATLTHPLAEGWSEATAACSPERRAEGVRVICEQALSAGSEAYGSFKTRSQHLGVLNSHGRFAYDRWTLARLVTVVMGPGTGTGYAERAAVDVGGIDAAAAGGEAVEKGKRSNGAEALEPGAYEVVLEPYCVAEMLAITSYIGFSALAVQEKRSFMRLGEQITGPLVTVEDMGRAPWTVPNSVDFEGVAKQPVTLIKAGVANAVVHDSFTAARDGVASTGHALPAPNPFGPAANHLRMATGEARPEEMARGIRRGLWVTRFHYVNVVEPMAATLTGMTRDGTFLIENGEVTRPVRNFRFTQSVLEALRDVRAIGSRPHLLADDGYGPLSSCSVPALHLGSFNFSGATSF